MPELLDIHMPLSDETLIEDNIIATPQIVGKMSVLEALAEETTGISINASHRSTQMGNGVDAEDD